MASGILSGGLPPDTSRGTQMLIAIWTMDAIGASVVAIRLFTSAAILRKVSPPDYLIVLAVLVGISGSALLTVSEHWGLGRHIMYLTPVQIEMSMKWQVIEIPLAIMCPAIGRLSFMLYLLKIFGIYKAKRYILHVCIWINLIVNILWMILVVTRCGLHATALWNPQAWGPDHCWPVGLQAYFAYFQGAINSSLDLVLTCLPAWTVWNLRIPRRAKRGLMVLLGFSLFAAIASVVRTVEIRALGEEDMTYNYIPFAIWLTVENNIVIVASSIPAIKPLFPNKKADSGPYEGHTLVGNLSGRTNSKSNKYSSHSQSQVMRYSSHSQSQAMRYSSHSQSQVMSSSQECELDGVVIKSTTVMQNNVSNADENYGRPSEVESQFEIARAV